MSELQSSPRQPAWLRVGLPLFGLALLGLAVWWLVGFLGQGSGAKKPSVQQVAILRQPPPPPPKPPEKPPEPQKLKDEVKVDVPKESVKPADAKPSDDKPASDKPLGLDAAGGAGNDGFGLAGSRGGRDLLSTGGGSGAYYTGLFQRQFFEALSRQQRTLPREFRVVVRVWLGDDGLVQRSEIVNGSGNPQVDETILATLRELPAMKEVPPPSMRPMQLRLARS